MKDVSALINAAGVALEAKALAQFGAAVQDSADRMLGKLDGVFDSPTAQSLQQQGAPQQSSFGEGTWDSTRYAAQNASRGMGSFSNAPKLKFLFKVSFSFFPEMIEYASMLNGTDLSELMRSLDCSVKQIDLPTVEFDYEEVNMYNFRTKVLKQIRHREVNLTFYDDIGNKALDFVNIYRMLYIPIARREQDANAELGGQGFTFERRPGFENSSTRDVLPSDKRNVLSTITIHQYYTDPGSGTPVKVNDFVFTNPRISNLAIGDQDHEIGGSPNTIACAFDFDSLYIDTGQSAAIGEHRKPPLSVMTTDITNAAPNVGQVSPGNKPNQFVPQVTSSSLFPAVATNQMGQALSGTVGTIKGALGEAATRTLSNAARGVSQGFALPFKIPVVDNTTPASQVENLTSQARSNDLGDYIA